jgi:lysine 2,3-aminomutase
MRHRIRCVDELLERFPGIDTRGIALAAERFPMAVTPYYASLVKSAGFSDPVFRMCVPEVEELSDPDFLSDDPLEEDSDMPVPGLVHRYPDRVLFIVTTTCASYCRHCTRKRVAGSRDWSVSARRLQMVVEYLSAHPEVTDVIVSGGDAFTLATEALEKILSALRSVASVEVIRIGTRAPVVMPMRITEELTSMLRRFHPVWVNTHFNHPNELTPEAAAACARLVDAGIPMGNQSVLLRGVNDDPKVIERLCRGLVRMRVRPYYLFQCDLVRGVEHFRTPLAKGIEIMEYMRGRVGGIAIPQFVVDAPHGGGKIPILPNYIISTSPTHTVLRNFEGMLVSYPEPGVSSEAAAAAEAGLAPGVWDLASGKASAIESQSERRSRRKSGKCALFDGA